MFCINFHRKLLLILIIIAISCSVDEEVKYELIYLEEFTDNAGEFDEFFYKGTEITLSSGNGNEEIFIPVIMALDVNSHGNIAIPDHSNNTIALFDSTGKSIRVIGEGEGRGPGEFDLITSFKFIDDDYLWVYDPGLMRVSVFSPPEYEFSHIFDVEMYFSDFLVDSNQNLILYTYHDHENQLLKLDRHGEIVENALKEENRNLKIFLGRFQGGGIKRGFNEDTFFAVYPGKFGIFEFGPDLDIISKITVRDSDDSKYRPQIPPFPSRLDPYDYTEAHENWWNSFLHISRLFTVDPNFLVLTMYEQTGSREWTFYVNIYDEAGKVIVEGLPLPAETRIVGAWKNKIFFAQDEQMLPDGNILPSKLTSYEIRKNME